MTSLEEMIDEARLLWHVLIRTGEQLHAEERVTLGMRAVLEYLARHGAATVPRIARGRRVTRQHIQALVDTLLKERLVAIEDNPAHRRSVLVSLTPEGEKTIERMKGRERRFFARVRPGVTAAEIERATKTLRAVRAKLERGA